MGSFMVKTVALAVAAAALVAVLAFAPVSGGSDAVSTRDRTVSVRDDFFSPRSVTVSRGDKVTWRWRGSSQHNVRFRRVPSGARKGGSTLKTSGRFARIFRERGRHRYVCTIHEDIGMKGSVNVE